jgi:hypothetical protein
MNGWMDGGVDGARTPIRTNHAFRFIMEMRKQGKPEMAVCVAQVILRKWMHLG